MAKLIFYADRTCAICGTVFKPNNSRARTCSPECSKSLGKINIAARLARGLEKECIACFKTFTPEHQGAKVCSEECRLERIRQTNVEHGKARLRDNTGVKDGDRLDVPLPEWVGDVPEGIDDPVTFEPGEFSEGQVRKYYGLDVKEPRKYVAKSLAECEALRGKTG